MDYLVIPSAIGVFLMMIMALWFCVNRLIWEFTDKDKSFLNWLGITK